MSDSAEKERAMVAAAREAIIESTDCVMPGGEGFPGWSEVLAERVVRAILSAGCAPGGNPEGEEAA